uniref:Uncharacterized protein n=1 Tax=Chromera velia CCMP2878 TaxID=1169474 RepID=A0A0G4IA72_9ALVE|eukprot:Cvel_12453.t1-p1 / transcript=Cvel_12453.t1 / gene=Cvel_12453 / organism=Chromera_velia_CCMP2878 / gene_product=hypothetical protein / transcript_product=hypothetical protein / location=Cvel_scaffold815:48925-50790(+) / protein_length=451 / sequence_SO=supercontig / SO=protein_coding / is_pseudo=false
MWSQELCENSAFCGTPSSFLAGGRTASLPAGVPLSWNGGAGPVDTQRQNGGLQQSPFAPFSVPGSPMMLPIPESTGLFDQGLQFPDTNAFVPLTGLARQPLKSALRSPFALRRRNARVAISPDPPTVFEAKRPQDAAGQETVGTEDTEMGDAENDLLQYVGDIPEGMILRARNSGTKYKVVNLFGKDLLMPLEGGADECDEEEEEDGDCEEQRRVRRNTYRNALPAHHKRWMEDIEIGGVSQEDGLGDESMSDVQAESCMSPSVSVEDGGFFGPVKRSSTGLGGKGVDMSPQSSVGGATFSTRAASSYGFPCGATEETPPGSPVSAPPLCLPIDLQTLRSPGAVALPLSLNLQCHHGGTAVSPQQCGGGEGEGAPRFVQETPLSLSLSLPQRFDGWGAGESFEEAPAPRHCKSEDGPLRGMGGVRYGERMFGALQSGCMTTRNGGGRGRGD